MTRTRTTNLEQFLLLFNAVKDAAGGKPSRITTFYGEHKPLKEAVNQLYLFMSFGDFERRVFHRPKKYHPQAPEGFEQAFREYKKDWEFPILDAMFPILLDLLDIPVDEDESQTEQQTRDMELVAPDPEHEDRFDPLTHDGAKAFEMAFWPTESYAEGANDDYADTINFAAKIGLEAYDYLTGTIGFNVEGAFRRWRNIPTIFMPAHVSNAHGMTERGSLFDLIDDAVQAYVFGAPAASMATCRATLEMILKHHYGLLYQYRDRKGRLRDKGLGELIILADEKYQFVQGGRLQKLSDGANKILHNYSGCEKMTDQDEKTILDFLKTIKFLIERAPN